MIMVIIVVNMNRIMPMTYLCQWFLFCRELPAPETWCPLLPGNLIIIMLMIKNHADSDSIQWFWWSTIKPSSSSAPSPKTSPSSPSPSPSPTVSITWSRWMCQPSILHYSNCNHEDYNDEDTLTGSPVSGSTKQWLAVTAQLVEIWPVVSLWKWKAERERNLNKTIWQL